MYGDYFDGQGCAEFCLASKGAAVPDCNVPDTLDKFLKSMAKFRFNDKKYQQEKHEQDTIYASGYPPPTSDVWKRVRHYQPMSSLSHWSLV